MGNFNYKRSPFYMTVTCCWLTHHITVAHPVHCTDVQPSWQEERISSCHTTKWCCKYLHHKWDTQLPALQQLWLLFYTVISNTPFTPSEQPWALPQLLPCVASHSAFVTLWNVNSVILPTQYPNCQPCTLYTIHHFICSPAKRVTLSLISFSPPEDKMILTYLTKCHRL